jgi:hypothetical protein
MSKTHRRNDDEDFEYINGQRCVKDGRAVSVRMALMDSMQRDVQASATPTRITDGTSNPHGLNKPGYRVERGGTADDLFIRDQERQKRKSIYDQYDADKANEWKQDVTGETVGKQQGDSCTVRNLGDIGVCGSRGTLRRIGGELVCVADETAKDAKQDCYDAYDEEIVNAWRGGGR